MLRGSGSHGFQGIAKKSGWLIFSMQGERFVKVVVGGAE